MGYLTSAQKKLSTQAHLSHGRAQGGDLAPIGVREFDFDRHMEFGKGQTCCQGVTGRTAFHQALAAAVLTLEEQKFVAWVPELDMVGGRAPHCWRAAAVVVRSLSLRCGRGGQTQSRPRPRLERGKRSVIEMLHHMIILTSGSSLSSTLGGKVETSEPYE